MIGAPFELSHNENNPLDLLEEFAESKTWHFQRIDDEMLALSVPTASKVNLEFSIEWQEEFSALLVACSMPISIAPEHYETAAKSLEQINQNLWLGHFDLSNQGKYPTFRHTLLLRMIPVGIAIDLIADTIEIAMAECVRFHTTFQLIQAGDVRLHDNLSAAIFETVGEA